MHQHPTEARLDLPLFAPLFKGEPDKNRGEQIFARWKAWHEAHPRFWNLFVMFTFELINAGHKHGSADMVCHRIRWQCALEDSGEPVKVNNDYTCLWARLFAVQYPNHGTFFRQRKRVSTDRPAQPLDHVVEPLESPSNEAELTFRLTEIAFQSTKEFSR